MLICLHYCRKDQHLALALAEWLAEIGPFPNHSLLLFRDGRTEKSLAVMFGFAGFGKQDEIVIKDDVANSWPASANHAFKRIAKHVQYSYKGVPFLYLEADCVVFRASAFDEIEAEYQTTLAAKKFFLGDLIDHRGNKQGANFVPHMSGIGVYPGRMTNYAGEVFHADDKTPWDIAAGPAIHSQAKQSELILHHWGREGQSLAPFKDWPDVEQKIFARRQKCALFHSDKTGTLLGLLRERKNFSGGVESEHAESLTANARHADSACKHVESAKEGVKCSALVSPDNASGSSAPSAENISGKEGDATCPETSLKRGCSAEPASQPESSADIGAIRYLLDQTPWESKEQSVMEIRNLATRLRQFQTNVAYVRFVRSLLAEAGVIVLPKKKRRKKRK